MANAVCTIVGAGPGLGRALGDRFAQAGHPVGFIARDQKRVDDYAAAVRARGIPSAGATANAGDPGSLTAAIRGVEAALGAPTGVLIYNAVAASPGLPSQLAPETAVADFQVSVGGALAAVQAVLPGMKDRGDGRILLTGGGLALHPNAQATSLSLGKVAIRSLAFMLAQELRGTAIRAATVTICGYIQTGTHFDPLRIAEVFYQTSVSDRTDAEIVYR